MPQELIFAPMGALALLTFLVLGFIPIRRFRAVGAGRAKPEDFLFGESRRVPGDVSIPNRNYMNLLELPMLFYVGGLMFYVAERVDAVTLVLAWTFVGLRAAHSLIHMTYNHILHRLSAFALSNFVLMAFWVWFFLRLGAG
ncbi:MAPEG family protein [Phenylobacterium sp. J367]|uniref:MAPEG family protein n=1 Tax=Phenylobacterium sp. J367 TaxID=2898435 RepID=UPI002151C013|nr:MAPEG family protein [Phenylobacterium sp. J367]MCR5880444.1 MAPEG family protein [Phenylobacterium sp. J367]